MYSTEDKTKVIMRLKNLRSENKVSCDHAVKRKMYILKHGAIIIEIPYWFGSFQNNMACFIGSIISQIEKMSVREFQNFVVLLSNSGVVSKTIINLSEVLTCDDCRKKYGGCNAEETNDCDKRFIKFSVEKVEKDIEH